MNTHSLTTIGLFTAVLCILGPICFALPFSPVPVSLGTLGIMLAYMILSPGKCLLCTLLYLLLGFVGLPVFAGFTGGVGKLLGPTGGYLLGYLLLAGIGSYLADKWKYCFVMQFCGLLLGMLSCYASGTIWLMIQTDLHIGVAVMTGVLPYILFDIGKIICALLLGNNMKKRGIRGY